MRVLNVLLIIFVTYKINFSDIEILAYYFINLPGFLDYSRAINTAIKNIST